MIGVPGAHVTAKSFPTRQTFPGQKEMECAKERTTVQRLRSIDGADRAAAGTANGIYVAIFIDREKERGKR